MSEISRLTQPPFNLPGQLRELDIRKLNIGDQVRLFHIQNNSQPIIRTDFVFQAGSRFQNDLFVAGCANSLLPEGTQDHSGADIAEMLDYFGSYVYPNYDRDEAGISAFFLEKHSQKNLDLVMEILQKPVFPETEIQVYQARNQQRLILDRKRTEAVSRRCFLESLLGANHPYGIHGEPEDLLALRQEQLVDFHKDYYHPGNLTIFITAPDQSEIPNQLEELIAKWPSPSGAKNPGTIPEPKPVDKEIRKYIHVPDSTQESIRMGLIVPGPGHPDFPKIQVLNTLLGGYFGSRLMQNIREEKGLTYGIGSSQIIFNELSILSIGSNVAKGKSREVIGECYTEIQKLKTTRISEAEFSQLRNYITGDLQRQLDGPFTTADTVKGLISSGLKTDHLHRFLEEIQKMIPEDLIEAAEEYLSVDKFVVCTAGPEE